MLAAYQPPGLNVGHNANAGIMSSFGICDLLPGEPNDSNDYLSITDNWIHDNGIAGVMIGWARRNSFYQVVTGNEIWGNGWAGGPNTWGMLVQVYSMFSTVHNNYIHDNHGDGLTIDGSVVDVTYNVVKRNTGGGILFHMIQGGSTAANNTSVANGGYGMADGYLVLDGGGNVARKNGFEPQCLGFVCASR